jgi:hypothetical protein
MQAAMAGMDKPADTKAPWNQGADRVPASVCWPVVAEEAGLRAERWGKAVCSACRR